MSWAAAHGMFGKPLFFASEHVRSGGAQLWSEFIATFGLLSVIWGVARRRSTAVPFGERASLSLPAAEFYQTRGNRSESGLF